VRAGEYRNSNRFMPVGEGHTPFCTPGNVAGEHGDGTCNAGTAAASTQDWACTETGNVPVQTLMVITPAGVAQRP